jgi:hypothetical protein
MSKNVISPLKPLTYSTLINSDKKNKTTVLNLELLATQFKIDMKLQADEYVKTQNPAFTSISYYQIQNMKRADKPDFSFNNPPKGPIQSGFICKFCEKNGTEFHDNNCPRPFNTSLVLNQSGLVLFPGKSVGAAYETIVKKSGQKKIISTFVRSETFTDNVEIHYENDRDQGTTIRVSRNGTINIISAQIGDDDLPGLIVKRINDTNAVMVKPFDIKTNTTYLLTAQFNLIPEQLKETSFVDLHTLHSNLWLLNLVKKKYQQQIVFMVNSIFYFVKDYNYNTGEQRSKGNKLTNPYIQFNLIQPETPNIKIHVMIYRKGGVQLKASYIDRETQEGLEYDVLTTAYNFLKQLLGDLIDYEEGAGTIKEETVKKRKPKIPNMVPDAQGNTRQPQKCQNRPAPVGAVRPVPYSFYGVCPQPNSYVYHVKRDDGKYEPCCRKFSETGKYTKQKWLNMIKNGYPDPDAIERGDIPVYGDSAVYIPGTKTVESRAHPGLLKMDRQKIINFLEKFNYIKRDDLFTKKTQRKAGVVFKQIKQLTSLTPFTTEPFIVSPYYEDTVRVKLFFEGDGSSIFVNEFGIVSETTIPVIDELSDTVVDGFLLPFKNTDFIFYIVDVSVFNGRDVSGLVYYSDTDPDFRIKYIKTIYDSIQLTDTQLNVSMHFDLNIVNGSEYLLRDPNVSGLLFTSFSGNFYLWTDNFNGTILINLQLTALPNGRWRVEGDIPNELLPQRENSIFLRKEFTKSVKLNTFILECKLNLNLTDSTKIDVNEPVIPVSILEQPFYTIPEVINILRSVKYPLSKEVFINLNKDPVGFNYKGSIYQFNGLNKPLTKT